MSDPDPAKARWMAIQMVRWTGLALFILGLLVYAKKIDLPIEAGWVLMAVGLLEPAPQSLPPLHPGYYGLDSVLLRLALMEIGRASCRERV